MQPTDKRIATVEQWQALKGVIDGNIGKAKMLTTADYNWPTDNPTQIALWLLEPGIYAWPSDMSTAVRLLRTRQANFGTAIVTSRAGGYTTVLNIPANMGYLECAMTTSDGSAYQYWTIRPSQDNLTSTSTAPLAANQGRVLKNLIDSIAIRGAGAPTTSTVGEVGQLYEDGTNGALYQLKSIDITTTPNTYNWEEVGGSNVALYTDVAGQNTDGAPTQKAVHDEIYGTSSPYRNGISIGMPPTSTADRGIRIALRSPGLTDSVVGAYGVAIGINTKATTTAGNTPSTAVGMYSQATGDFAGAFAGGNASGVRAIAIGAGSTASGSRAIAIGSNSTATLQGEINIGNGTATTLYNGSGYRLLTGLYDPQNAHDAATKGYVDTQVGNIDTALQTLLNGTGA